MVLRKLKANLPSLRWYISESRFLNSTPSTTESIQNRKVRINVYSRRFLEGDLDEVFYTPDKKDLEILKLVVDYHALDSFQEKPAEVGKSSWMTQETHIGWVKIKR
jgi:hypothetical protein